MYIKRHLAEVIEKAKAAYPSVLITGARQVGKSTLLRNTIEKSARYITLDDYIILDSIKKDPMGFVRSNNPPIIIDEIQYAPEIFRSIKMNIDETNKKGQYFMTGSQAFELMEGVSESLAGRVAIFNLLGLSNREIEEDDFTTPFIPSEEYLRERNKNGRTDTKKLWHRIHRGSMPILYSDNEMDSEQYYSSYVKTYIERDVRALSQVGDELAFMQFLTALAARTGELLNMASISKDIGISQPTIKRWLSILEASNIIFLLQPFSLNVKSRVVKTPKVYFCDTGLVCYLCKWLTPETLQNGAMAGNIFETFVVTEIIKSYFNKGKSSPLYFYRDTNGKEVDLLFYQNGTLYPLEIKKTASPNLADIKHFKVLETAFPSLKIGEGGVVCLYDNLLNLDEKNRIIPLSYI